jgi:hypothetical protein
MPRDTVATPTPAATLSRKIGPARLERATPCLEVRLRCFVFNIQARQLLPARYLSSISERIYDVSPDGQRFLMLYAGGGRIVVVQDWLEELKQRLPVH